MLLSSLSFLKSRHFKFIIFLVLLNFRSNLFAQNFGTDPIDRANNPVTKCYAFKNVKIFQSPTKIIEKGNIIIRNGLITSVGANAQIPNDAHVIEGDSLIAYAGFVDGLTNSIFTKKEEKDLPKIPRPGDPPNDRAGIQPERDVTTMLNINEAAIDSLRMNGFLLARVVPQGKMLPGNAAIITLGGKLNSDLPLRKNESMFFQFVDAGEIYPSTTMGVMAKFRQLFREAAQTKSQLDKFNAQTLSVEKPEYNETISAFFPVVQKNQSISFYAPSTLEARRILALQKELDFRLNIIGLNDGFKMINELKNLNAPIFLTLSLPKNKKPDEKINNDSILKVIQNFSTNQPSRIKDFNDVKYENEKLVAKQVEIKKEFNSNAATLKNAGINYGFSSYNTSISDIRENLRTMILMGLQESDLLAALTINGAKNLGLEKQFGTIEEGKIGNIFISKGNFFKENSEIKFALANGVLYKYNKDKDQQKAATNKANQDSINKANQTKLQKDSSLQASIYAAQKQLVQKYNFDHTNNWLIKNATVLTVTNGTMQNTDIAIQNGKISAIGKNLSAPKNSKTLDATGMYAMPGIIDAHSHIAISDVNEWTTPISAEVWEGDVLDPTDINIYRAMAGGVTTSHLMHGSANAIGGQCQTIKHRWGVTFPDSLRFDAAPRTIKFALGENPTRVHGKGHNVRPNTRMGVEQVFRDAFSEAKRYDELKKEYELNKKKNPNLFPPKYNIRLEALADILNGKIQIHCHSYRADEIYMLMKVLKEFGVTKITFQHVNEGFKVAPELAQFGAGASVFSDWWSYKFEVYYSTSYNAAILTRNNVVTSINSDSPELVRHLNHEAAKSLRYGELTEDEALKMITINPAKQLSIDSRVGSLEVGKDADIAIFSANPLSIYSVCQNTFVDGVMRFNREQDPDDVRLYASPTDPVDTVEDFDKDEEFCMQRNKVK